jgi:hypothetical protein
MYKSRIIGLVSCLALALAHEAAATPISWTLTSVTFADGATASGSFVYDAGTQSLSAFDVTTTATPPHDCGPGCTLILPTDLPGHHYLDLTGFNPPYPKAGFAVTDPPAPVTGYAGLPFLALVFASPLSDAGGSLALSVGEGFCIDAGCVNGTYIRSGSGSVAGTPVPEPASVLLFGSGLAAVIRRRLRQRA